MLFTPRPPAITTFASDKSTPSDAFLTTSFTIVRKSLISTDSEETAPVRDSSLSSGAMLLGRTVAKIRPSVITFFSNALPE